jgi:hypothetical protein
MMARSLVLLTSWDCSNSFKVINREYTISDGILETYGQSSVRDFNRFEVAEKY